MPIRQLPPAVVAGISAGEVVERPAAVVKELVENALDAGAARIAVETEGAGLKLIAVSDDGAGIPPGEALLAFARHTTSKLASLADLERIGTFGFRGEALAAIAASAEVELLTRPSAAESGTRVRAGAGRPAEAEPVGCAAGTRILIRNLFKGVPARLKFLKSPAAETAAIARALEPYLLSHPAVGFSLVVDGEERLAAPPVRDPAERLRLALGGGAGEWLPAAASVDGCAVLGFVQAPESVRRRGRLLLLVNRRPVEDKALRHALVSAYAGALPRDAFPAAALLVDIPPGRVDVNVHPAKTEVRFADPQMVYRVVQDAVRGAFRRSRPAGAPAEAAPEAASPAAYPAAGPAPEAAEAPLFWSAPQRAGGAVEVIAQVFRTYIVARDSEGLLLVDQHTAHERVIYERLAARPGAETAQALLTPVPVELTASEAPLAAAHVETLRAAGLEIEGFGGNTVVVRAAPPGAADRDLPALLRWLLEEIERAGSAPASLAPRLQATVACHLAVKAGDRLAPREMEAILAELRTAREPGTCPHGRPTSWRLDEQELAARFQRTWGLGKRECH